MGTASALYTFILENIWPRVVFEIVKNSQYLNKFSYFLSNILFIFIANFTTEIFKHCKHLLSTMILHNTASCPKIAIVSDFYGEISNPKYCAMFYNVNFPLCKLSSESVIMT